MIHNYSDLSLAKEVIKEKVPEFVCVCHNGTNVEKIFFSWQRIF